MLHINVVFNGVQINDTLIKHPFKFDEFVEVLGEPTLLDNPNTQNATYVWNDSGVRVFVNEEGIVTEYDIYLIKSTTANYVPDNLFTGELNLDGKPYQSAVTISPDDYLFTKVTVGEMIVDAQLTKDTPKQIKVVTLRGPDTPQPVAEKLLPKKASKPLTFKDFNFKLAVMNELMYEQKVLTPSFDVQSVVKIPRIRVYTINTLRYDPVEEAIQFFDEYEIDASYAPLITSLYLDGGNEIYRNIAPHWDGETNDFDIESFADVDLFPNLKEITNELFPMSDAVKDELTSKGITIH